MELKSKERRYRCKRCGQTSAFPPPRAHLSIRYTSHMNWLPSAATCRFVAVLRKRSSAFTLDERTHILPPAADESGQEWRRAHEHLVQAGRVLLAQVKSDPAFEPSSDGALIGWVPLYLRGGCNPVSRDFDQYITLRQTTGKTCR